MKSIQKLAESLKEEVEGAKEYAEEYIEHKAVGDMSTANHFREMANDELRHAMFFHELATKKIAEVSKIYTPPVEMEEAWRHAHKKYVEEVASIRKILDM